LLSHLVTRIYFADEAANADDPVLTTLDPARRQTLLAQQEEAGGITRYRFDIRLQGERETVFFDP
jgi:protocatechuate 3,4-dioxygenase alpha subunit